MTTRYGQLSYTSFDTVGTAGGWQVKQTAGDITPDESHLLVSGIHTALEPVQPLPAYPTPDQVKALPRRLAYRRIDDDAAAYWHTVPAGLDSTGRPGNIFAHVLLDRDTRRAAPRPIELWRSARWLAPYGGQAVRDAVLPDDVPAPGGAVTAHSVVEFACDTTTWRLSTLCGLLDGVAAALDGGPPVVLGVDSIDTAAQWIGAVSFLMSPGTARRLNFSTFDRSTDLEHSLRAGLHLIAMPRADLGHVPHGVLVIDETETLSMGELGGQHHRTGGGQDIAVTAWSAMAQVALIDPESAAQLLTDIDEFAARVDDVGLAPALPMAIAVLNRDEWGDAVPEARLTVAAHATPSCAADPAVARIVDSETQRLVGATTADAWRATDSLANSASLIGDAARAVYLSRAIRDDRWLSQPGPIPVPAQRFSPGTVPDDVAADAAAVLSDVDARDPALLLRTVDLLAGTGLGDIVAQPVEQKIVPALLDPGHGRWLITDLHGQISRDTRLLVAAAILTYDGSQHIRLDPPLLKWLAEDVGAPTADQLSRAHPGDPVWTAAALRGLLAAESGAPQPQDRYLALWWLRMHDVPLPQCEYVFGGGPWDPAELLVATGDGPLPARLSADTLVGAADSAELRALADRVLGANTDDTAVACAAVRVYEPGEWITTGYLQSHYRAYTPYWDALLAELGPTGVHHDFAVRFVVLAALGVVIGAPEPESCAALLTDPNLAAEMSYHLESLVSSGAVDVDALIAAALVSADGASGARRVLQPLAARQAALREAAGLDGVVDKMAQLTGAGSDGDLRRLRKTATKLLSEWQVDANGVRTSRTHRSR
ncbi:hypothetical protein E2F47_10860 [Mycobacterium eburneum]|nr:hypothetical protein [Mycobacterium eburneum]TDH55064.1 hypothetical protein E2F47_10860 [Mycobacterium eburneum]